MLAAQGDERATERLVVDNMPLVRSVAVKFKDRGTEYDDLVQIGTIGMIKAIRSFDVERGTAFSTYAVPLIVGEIRKHLRDDGPIKVGREYKRMGAALLGERNRMIASTGREPSIGELAACCGVSVEDAAVALDAVAPVTSLSETVYDDSGLTLEGTLPDQDSADETERMLDKLALSQAISRLDPLWRKIVLLRYWRNMTQQQVATALGLSQVKVSREENAISDDHPHGFELLADTVQSKISVVGKNRRKHRQEHIDKQWRKYPPIFFTIADTMIPEKSVNQK